MPTNEFICNPACRFETVATGNPGTITQRALGSDGFSQTSDHLLGKDPGSTYHAPTVGIKSSDRV
jgi:hypothetical protein